MWIRNSFSSVNISHCTACMKASHKRSLKVCQHAVIWLFSRLCANGLYTEFDLVSLSTLFTSLSSLFFITIKYLDVSISDASLASVRPILMALVATLLHAFRQGHNRWKQYPEYIRNVAEVNLKNQKSVKKMSEIGGAGYRKKFNLYLYFFQNLSE